MPIYRLEIKGRTAPLLVKEESAAKAKDRVVKAVALSAEEMVDALAGGESVWAGDKPFPADGVAS